MREPLAVGVVGVGHLGRWHAHNYRSLPGVRLAAVCDAREEVARTVGEDLGVPWVRDAGQLPEALDAVSVATPAGTHFEVARPFLERGISVLVEKPLATDAVQARELVRLARATGAKLQVGHVERFNPVMEAIRDIRQSPLFLECHRLAPFTFRALDVGVVLDLMIHDLDIVLSLVEKPIRNFHAVGGPIFSPTEDVANVRIEFEGGTVANITANRVALQPMRRTRIFFPDAYVALDFGKRHGLIARKRPGASLDRLRLTPADLGNRALLQAVVLRDLIDLREETMEEGEPLRRELQSFVKAVREDREPTVTGEDGLRALEVALDILHALHGPEVLAARRRDSRKGGPKP